MEHNHGHAHGGSKPTFNMVFGILAVLTVLEVISSELPLPRVLHYSVLLGLAGAKAALVVAFYMHLKYDPPIFTWILVVPIIMGFGVILSLQALAGY